NVNPLICASGVLKVAMSDDKIHDGIVETTALIGMFAGEALMKDNFNNFFNEQTFKNIAKKSADKGILTKFSELVQKSKYTGKVASVMKGIAFVLGSIGSYSLAQKAGEKYAEDVIDFFGLESKEKINQKV
ncbi:hypothetical protein J6A31_06815, partial [bacterium]|nr:hypothetical protein [bacterium]